MGYNKWGRFLFPFVCVLLAFCSFHRKQEGEELQLSVLSLYTRSSISLSEGERESIIKNLNQDNHENFLLETLLSEKEIFFRFGFFLSKEKRAEFASEIQRGNITSVHGIYQLFTSRFTKEILDAIMSVKEICDIPDSKIAVFHKKITAEFISDSLNEFCKREVASPFKIISSLWSSCFDFSPFPKDSVHFQNILLKQGVYPVKYYLHGDWINYAVELFFAAYIKPRGSNKTTLAKSNEIFKNFKGLYEENILQKNITLSEFLSEYLVSNADGVTASSVMDNIIFMYKNILNEQEVIHFLESKREEYEKGLLKGITPKKINNEIMEKFSEIFLEERGKIIDNVFLWALRRYPYQDGEAAHYKKRLSGRSFFDVYVDILTDRPYYAKIVDWDTVQLWPDVRMGSFIAKDYFPLPVLNVDGAYNPSVVKHPSKPSVYILLFRKDYSFGTPKQTSDIGYIEFSLRDKKIELNQSTLQWLTINSEKNTSVHKEDPRAFVYRKEVYVLYNDDVNFSFGKRRKQFFSKLLLTGDVPKLGPPIYLQAPTSHLKEEDPVKKMKKIKAIEENVEKNWVPIVRDDALFFLYAFDFDPAGTGNNYTVFSFDFQTNSLALFKEEEITRYAKWKSKYGALRGGSPFIKTEDGFFSFAHSSTTLRLDPDKYASIFYFSVPVMLSDTDLTLESLGAAPVNADGLYNDKAYREKKIFFPSGILKIEDDVYLFGGRNDDAISVLRFQYGEILQNLHDHNA